MHQIIEDTHGILQNTKKNIDRYSCPKYHLSAPATLMIITPRDDEHDFIKIDVVFTDGEFRNKVMIVSNISGDDATLQFDELFYLVYFVESFLLGWFFIIHSKFNKYYYRKNMSRVHFFSFFIELICQLKVAD